jgi:hypothetical protein
MKLYYIHYNTEEAKKGLSLRTAQCAQLALPEGTTGPSLWVHCYLVSGYLGNYVTRSRFVRLKEYLLSFSFFTICPFYLPLCLFWRFSSLGSVHT